MHRDRFTTRWLLRAHAVYVKLYGVVKKVVNSRFTRRAAAESKPDVR
ncbi:MAG: hypothetical protein M5R36_26330 [Deltaproteobacteria bacterium]|nr:hypothetical protein [Deltaproteobacteria bacterium]